MRDAFGGILNLAIIAVFLVVVMGVLGLTFSYTKAFKAKNIILSRIEQYEGHGCFEVGKACFNRIQEDTKSIGYSPSVTSCAEKYEAVGNIFCYKAEDVNDKTIFKIVSQVDIPIPIVNKILNLSFFEINGDTRPVKYK